MASFYRMVLARRTRPVFMNYCGFLSIISSADYQRFILCILFATQINCGMNIKWEVMGFNWAVDVTIYHKKKLGEQEIFARPNASVLQHFLLVQHLELSSLLYLCRFILFPGILLLTIWRLKIGFSLEDFNSIWLRGLKEIFVFRHLPKYRR
jgi:hypothetical protein